MKVKLTEQQFRRVIVEEQSKIGAILMTGSEASRDHEDQKKDFIKGFGSDNIAAFPYNKDDISTFLETIEENLNVPVVLYSAAGRHVATVAAVMNNIKNLYVVEPWWNGNKKSSRYLDMQASGIPPQNVQVHHEKHSSGYGIVDNPTYTPKGMNHFQALTYAGSKIKHRHGN
jgi:hypothetical protein